MKYLASDLLSHHARGADWSQNNYSSLSDPEYLYHQGWMGIYHFGFPTPLNLKDDLSPSERWEDILSQRGQNPPL